MYPLNLPRQQWSNFMMKSCLLLIWLLHVTIISGFERQQRIPRYSQFLRIQTSITTSKTSSAEIINLRAAIGGNSLDDNVERQLARARELLAKSKEKLQQREAIDETSRQQHGTKIPFFATLQEPSKSITNTQTSRTDDSFNKENGDTNTDKRSFVTKTRNEQTGLITTDGELMAKLSENEQWERRSIWELFDQTEVLAESVREEMEKQLIQQDDPNGERRSVALNELDVAASIFNLRKSLQKEDYKAIFDTKNRFIGEDN